MFIAALLFFLIGVIFYTSEMVLTGFLFILAGIMCLTAPHDNAATHYGFRNEQMILIKERH